MRRAMRWGVVAGLAVLGACGGGSSSGGEAVPLDPVELDLAADFGLSAGQRLEPDGELSARLELPRGARLLFDVSSSEASQLRVEIASGGSALLDTTLDVPGSGRHSLDLAEVGAALADLRLTLAPGAAPVELDGLHLWVDPNRPNLILILVDTLRADVLISRRDTVDTPRIDDLARDGVPFLWAFAHAPMTLPSHTSLFSSRYPFETGVLNNGQVVPPDLPLLAEHLAEQGYDTRAVVSLGTLWPDRKRKGVQLDRGFASYVHTPGHVTPAPVVGEAIADSLEGVDPARPLFFFAHFCDPHGPYNVHGQRRDGTPPFEADVFLDGELLARVTTSDATYWKRKFTLGPGDHSFVVESEKNTNVRIFNVFDPSGDSIAVEYFDREGQPLVDAEGEPVTSLRGRSLRHVEIRFENDRDAEREFEIEAWFTDHVPGRSVAYRYFREVDFVDGYVGQVIDRLKERGLYEHSIVVFTSDHGEALGTHNYIGHVKNLFDEMTHVPLILKPQRGSDAGEALRARSGGVVPHVDVVPTLLEMSGLAPLAGQRGTSLLVDGERTAISETHSPEADENQIAKRDARHKLIFYADRDTFELYDLQEDPFELNDVFAQRGGEFEHWQEELRLIARLSEGAGLDWDSLSDDDKRRMEAMGYAGGD